MLHATVSGPLFKNPTLGGRPGSPPRAGDALPAALTQPPSSSQPFSVPITDALVRHLLGAQKYRQVERPKFQKLPQSSQTQKSYQETLPFRAKQPPPSSQPFLPRPQQLSDTRADWKWLDIPKMSAQFSFQGSRHCSYCPKSINLPLLRCISRRQPFSAPAHSS